METLFDDKETFTKVRPIKIPEKQLKEFYRELAEEIVKENWASEAEDIDDIISDLDDLYISDSGYERAKHLENHGRAN